MLRPSALCHDDLFVCTCIRTATHPLLHLLPPWTLSYPWPVTAGSGALRASEFAESLSWDESPHQAPLGDILRVHDWAYVRRIQVGGIASFDAAF